MISSLYVEAPLLTKLLIKYRPYICPLEPLIEQVPDNASVYDIGCGNGLFLANLAIAGKVKEGIGFDTNTLAIGNANKMADLFLKKTSKEILYFTDNIHSPLISEKQFDVVSLVDVMHHIPPSTQREAFADAVRHVRPGGLILYKDMCSLPLWKAFGNRLHDLVLAQEWIHYVPLGQVKTWAKEENLTLINEKSYSRFWYGHELLILQKPL
jgi:SAM-dependent methyltransferase